MDERPAGWNPKRIWLKEADRERLRRSEFEAMRCLLGAVSYAAHAQDDLQDRMQCIDRGKARMAMMIGCMRAIIDDLLGTVPEGQRRQLRNTMQDMEMRMVPKLTGMSTNVIFEQSIAKGLMDQAMEQCKGCVEDSKSCRKCTLYKILESSIPLDNYDSMSCPYARSEWED